IACTTCGFNITGSSVNGVAVVTTVDAIIVSRKMAGVSGAALTDGLNLGSGTRNTPPSVQTFLATGCGQPTPVCSAGSVLCATARSPTTAILEWNPVNGAVDYELSRGSSPLILAEDTQLRFRAIDLIPGSTNTFRWRALDGNGATLASASVALTQPSGSEDLTARDLPPFGSSLSRAMTSFGWSPDPRYDTCTKPLHDAFWTYGPDNKIYATWHPPIYEFANGETCRFGHEHGQDQRASNVYASTGALPFGYVNEQLSPNDPSFQRNEDHVSHKVALFNGLLSPNDQTLTNELPLCDVLFKLHQGTHSPDALRNNSHERFLNYQCYNDFARTQPLLNVRWKSLQGFGAPNSFLIESSNQFSRLIQTQGASPPNQPAQADRRVIPTPEVMISEIAKFGNRTETNPLCDNCTYVSTFNFESWQGGPQQILVNASGQRVFQFAGGPYWNLSSSARYYDPSGDASPASSNYLIARQIDLCYQSNSPIYNAEDCRIARSRNGGQPIAWNSPLSPFNGAKRFNEVNFIQLFNPDPNNRRLFFTPYGLMNYSNGNLQRIRSAEHPIRNVFSMTSVNGVGVKSSNFAGTNQCGGGSCWTDFNRHTLRNGQTINAGVRAPN
ncbi:MAG: hypothetical protein ACRDAM_08555, partial [Casimicrobium sp.]